ncbi:ethanolamine ammonia-lyase subunit EutC [Marinomonas pollencensis]|uniref:Ethanolamine ammonia-lyase small subunit n=1 Tax=Marinomonas pollencensis TaxID=491954 RepID=A0A3E0DLN1_9GAMM|nr:ethanolamine ammonia-lyase subunit EutC [Marinomonas pollencensis]REG83671.1 ethanolamine ammonia-lyase light chain [Marinomonas pollencensis]
MDKSNKNTPQLSPTQPHHDAQQPVTANPWRKLNAFTDARVGLGRAGISLPTKHLLDFQLAHAQAIDAVHTPLDLSDLSRHLVSQNWAPDCAPLLLHSRAIDRSAYLQRPDFGRLLDASSANQLDCHKTNYPEGYDLAIAIVDGLSALAVQQNTLPFLNALFELLPLSHNDDAALAEETSSEAKKPWTLAPICLVEQGRVAIGDDICQRLNAKCVLVLVGERPGLSSPDSLGLYLTWEGKVGHTDAYRNCISNVRPAGLKYQEAAKKAYYLLTEARRRQQSGVTLKDRSDDEVALANNTTTNFLVSQ